ncbi:MAG: serine/threonine protein kinase [Propionibacteriaceae bacterium]|jgi:serine/threonine protein kinase|nr:serine/threonine protein kinase [Propionibacteriaceae bacterium]
MRAPAQAPVIPGLTSKRLLGTGGFADVFLYESANPRRDVAVKVMHDNALSPRMIQRFADEANTMAALEHPNIVRVYSSGFTQDGRPYIEMAYYSQETLAQAARRGPMPVADVLRVGIQLASAVEAAHQVGLLHRDIKPANVLIDKFGDPALTDFGIASHLHEVDNTDASLSVPWAAPEAMFATGPLDRRCDIYSLAATLWHVLVGHSPFEAPGGDNRPTAMMVRVRDLPVPSTGRGDVPSSLERLLRQAMSKDPRSRPATAVAFARALGAIEEELRLRATPFKVAHQPDESLDQPPATNDELTRVRSASVSLVATPPGVAQQSGAGLSGQTSRSDSPDATRAKAVSDSPALSDPVNQSGGSHGSETELATRRRGEPAVDDLATRRRGGPSSAVGVSDDDPAAEEAVADQDGARPVLTTRRRLITTVVLVVVAALAVAAWIVFSPDPEGEPGGLPTASIPPDDTVGDIDTYPGTPVITSTIADGMVTFQWEYDQADPSDFYWIVAPDGARVRLEDPVYTTAVTGEKTCVSVSVNRATGAYAQIDPTQGCAP